ncbi:uncharacterized protein LOC113275200 isoform X2 [Papaver somniferum]|uniref:uncharacterized protein LOC113275200 isoform X2 n=1 Tax=Papaver somniferum TaxID=3469 RepID=UPI000E6FFF2E|nr:uncharacterized protein LOC113275200 isoform X2 [Papaver somniferum]
MVTYNWIWRFNIQKRIKRKRWWWWSGNGGSGEFFLLPKKKGTQMMVVVMISWVRYVATVYWSITSHYSQLFGPYMILITSSLVAGFPTLLQVILVSQGIGII